MVISSLENKEIKNYCKLKQKKYREEQSLFLVEGLHLIEEAYKKNLLEKIILLENEINNFDVDCIYVTQEIINKLSTLDTPPNMIGICKIVKQHEIKGTKILLLDHIQDPGNLGTIIRSSKAFGIDTIVLSNDTVDLYNPKVIRATQGIIFHINIIKTDLVMAIKQLKSKNIPIYSTNVEAGEDIKSIALKMEKNGYNLESIAKSNKYAVIVGNEGNGVSKNISELADYNLYIKMNQDVESLNVAVATSIILYELER